MDIRGGKNEWHPEKEYGDLLRGTWPPQSNCSYFYCPDERLKTVTYFKDPVGWGRCLSANYLREPRVGGGQINAQHVAMVNEGTEDRAIWTRGYRPTVRGWHRRGDPRGHAPGPENPQQSQRDSGMVDDHKLNRCLWTPCASRRSAAMSTR